MLSKEQLKEQYKDLLRKEWVVRRIDIGDGFYKVEIRSKGWILLAEIDYIELEPNIWEVCHSYAAPDFKGKGKLIYYCAMNFVYPAYIISDLAGAALEAQRVYSAMDRLDYVEKKDFSIDVGEIKIVTAYRFKFKPQ